MADDGEHVEYTEVTVKLIPASVSALEDISMMEGRSATDAVNRSLQVYRYLMMEKSVGKKLAWCELRTRWKVFRLRKIWGFDFE